MWNDGDFVPSHNAVLSRKYQPLQAWISGPLLSALRRENLWSVIPAVTQRRRETCQSFKNTHTHPSWWHFHSSHKGIHHANFSLKRACVQNRHAVAKLCFCNALRKLLIAPNLIYSDLGWAHMWALRFLARISISWCGLDAVPLLFFLFFFLKKTLPTTSIKKAAVGSPPSNRL